MKKIYLDYAASTPVDKEVQKAMAPFLRNGFGNPSSLHWFGQEARAGIERARERVAKFLNCQPLEVVFTSGATEANNLIIRGIKKSPKPHIITTQIEHESVLAPCQQLESEGAAEVTYVAPDAQGIVYVEDIEKALRPNTELVSVMYANSEIGSIQPIAEIGAAIKNRALFHVDAAQAAQFLDCNVQKLGVDFLTLSSHKIYGPKGAGVVYIKEGTALEPLLLGGGQEQGLRSGTENTAAIVGMGKAIEEIQHPTSNIQNIRIRQLRDVLIKEILKKIPGTKLTGSAKNRLPSNAHFRFEGITGKDLVMLLDRKGIAVSVGSACSEKTEDASHVLLALGFTSEDALSSVRLTLGKYTVKEEIRKAVNAIASCVDELRTRKV